MRSSVRGPRRCGTATATTAAKFSASLLTRDPHRRSSHLRDPSIGAKSAVFGGLVHAPASWHKERLASRCCQQRIRSTTGSRPQPDALRKGVSPAPSPVWRWRVPSTSRVQGPRRRTPPRPPYVHKRRAVTHSPPRVHTVTPPGSATSPLPSQEPATPIAVLSYDPRLQPNRKSAARGAEIARLR